MQSSVQLQSVFLEYLCKNSVPTTLFLVNGVKLQGFVTAFDNFSVLLTRDDRSQLVYKHAISAAHPLPPIHLGPRKRNEENSPFCSALPRQSDRLAAPYRSNPGTRRPEQHGVTQNQHCGCVCMLLLLGA